MNSRKNNRLEFYDYSQNGAYFVTICAKDKQKIFWNNQQCSVGAVSGRPQDKLNHLGLIVKIGIEKIPLYYQNLKGIVQNKLDTLYGKSHFTTI